MSPEQVQLVRHTHARIEAIAAYAGRRFYACLFDLAPELRSHFPDAIDVQADKLMSMLALLVATLDRPAEVERELRQLGVRHRCYGAEEQHFDAVGSALIHMLREVLADAFTAEVEDAWGVLYGTLVETMIDAVQA